MGDACPACSARGGESFYQVDGIPVHSVLLMRSVDEARSYTKRDLRLSACEACGFVWNAAFDPSVHEYSTRCEESQGCSPTFSKWVNGLAQRLVDEFGVRHKRVLEIGCGKGEFLAALCDAGENMGVGIDPAFIPGRLPAAQEARIEALQELYSEAHADIHADVVCCRHTLEHIAPVRVFMETIERTIREAHETLVFFELPDAGRVLRESAFWDIYYEHCSYFTPGSLARLYRRIGFSVTGIELAYADQYILAFGYPDSGPGSHGAALANEESVADVMREVERFSRDVVAAQDRWRSDLQQRAARGESTVLWGGGSKGVSFLTTLGLADEVAAVVDINPHKQGMFMPGTGHAVVGPADLQRIEPDCVVLMNPVYRDEISADLDRLGLAAEILVV